MKSTSTSSDDQSVSIPVGVIGAGRLGTFHARKLTTIPGVKLVGIVDPIPDRRQSLAKECRCEPLADYRELFGHCAAVVVAVPTSLHYTTTMDCLEAGIHAFVEKPITAASQQAQHLLATASKNNLILQVGHVERFNPAYQAVQPFLGDIQLIEVSRCGPFSFRITDVGVVMDLMIHDLDLILTMVRRPIRHIDATGLSVLGTHEDMAVVRIEFEGGAVAVLKASRIEQEPTRTMRIWHRKGQAIVDFARRTTSVCQYPEDIQTGLFRIEELDSQELEQLKQVFHTRFFAWHQLEIANCDPLEAELRDFIRAICQGTRPLVTGEDGLAAVQLAEQILERIRTSKHTAHTETALFRHLPKAA